MSLVLRVATLSLLLSLSVLAAPAEQTQQEHVQAAGDELAGIREMKRFYSWEGAKRSAPLLDDDVADGYKEKRKFYAWAGKRSGVAYPRRPLVSSYDLDLPLMAYP